MNSKRVASVGMIFGTKKAGSQRLKLIGPIAPHLAELKQEIEKA